MLTPNLQPTLRSELLRLEPLKPEDFEALYQVAADPQIWEQHPNNDRYKVEVFRLYFDSAIASKGAFLIIEQNTNRIIGCTRYYHYEPQKRSVAIGYTFLAKAYWGGQYNKIAKQLLLDHIFSYVDKVYFFIGSQNIRSQKGTMRIGAKKLEPNDPDYVFQADSHTYLISKNQWANRQPKQA